MAVNCRALQKGFGFNTTSLWTRKPRCMQSRVITSDSIQICNTDLPSVRVALTISATDLCCCFCGAHNLTYQLESGSERWLHDHSWRKRADIVHCFFHWGDFHFMSFTPFSWTCLTTLHNPRDTLLTHDKRFCKDARRYVTCCFHASLYLFLQAVLIHTFTPIK